MTSPWSPLPRGGAAGRGLSALSPGMRYMIAGAFFFSLMSLGVKLAGQRLPPQEIVLVRGVITALLSYAMLRRARVRPWGIRPPALILRGLFGFAALSCVYYALIHLPLADATVLQYTNPVWTVLLAAWLLDEYISPRDLLLVLASLSGVVVIARPSFLFGAADPRLNLVAVGVAVAGAMFSACAYVTVRKLARTEHPLVIVFYFTLVTVPGALPGTISEALWPTPLEWAYLLGVGVAAQAGQVYFTRGLQLEPAGRATAASYLQVVFAALLGLAFFDEVPDLWVVTGAVVILSSTVLLARNREDAVSGRREGVAETVEVRV